MNSTSYSSCRRCSWHIFPEDIFCGGCGYQLARITITPDPDEYLTIFSGIPITLKVKNEGDNSVEIQGLKSESFEITQLHGIDMPHTLNRGEDVELRYSHNAPEYSMGQLELLSSISSVQRVDFFVQCEPAPEISLGSDSHLFAHDTDEYQDCAIDPVDGRISLTLRHDSQIGIQASPDLSEGEDYFMISGLSQEFPARLSPEDTLQFSLTRRQDFEETCRVVLNFRFDGLGEIIFKLSLRCVERPKISRGEFSRQFTNEQALISGQKKKIPFTVTVSLSSGPPLRIDRVESNQRWLSVTTNQNFVIDDDLSEEIGLLLNQNDLPTAEESSTTVGATLDIHGSTISEGDSEGESFHQPINLPVQIRPPEHLDHPIAVDFGTTNSCIAYINPNPQVQNKSELLEIDHGGEPKPISKIPTVFQFLAIEKPDDHIEFENDPSTDEKQVLLRQDTAHVRFDHRLKFDLENIGSTAWGFKRALITPDEQMIYNDQGTGNIRLNGRIYTQGNRYIEVDGIERVGLYIRFLLESFQENTGYLPTEAVFTYPAVFNRQKEALREAIDWATQEMDIKPILDISEPEAIALYYALEDIAQKQDAGQDIIYGVFDCGGGTTDISIVRLQLQQDESLVVEILASDGDNALGGDLLSFKIARYLYDQVVPEGYRAQFPFPNTLEQALRLRAGIEKGNFYTLYKLAEEIKENRKIRYRRTQSNDAEELREKGILDLLKESSGRLDNWPSITLKSSENTDLRVISSERILGDTQLPPMDSLTVDDIYESVREELEKGFEKINQMLEYLFENDIQLDYLILEGNSSRFPLIKQIAQEKVRAKEIIFKSKKIKTSVGLGAVEYGRTLKGISDIEVHGIHKLNYPICLSAYARFIPVFNRWTPLEPNEIIKSETPSRIRETKRASSDIVLYEFFGWDFNIKVTQGENRVVAKLIVPKEESAFQNAQFWTYCLELRCDAEGKASLWYNYRVGNEKDGSDFEDVWEAHRKCEEFSYT